MRVVAYDSSHYRMADRVADGKLAAILASYQTDRLSAGAISRRLYAEHGIEVTVPTVRKWLDSLDVKAAS